MVGKVLLIVGFILTSARSIFAADSYATPSGAGLQNDGDWANAFSQFQIDGIPSVVDSVIQPSDVLHLGGGPCSQPIHLPSGGMASSPRKIIDEDTGDGLPIIHLDNWLPNQPGNAEHRAIGFGNAATSSRDARRLAIEAKEDTCLMLYLTISSCLVAGVLTLLDAGCS